MPAKTEQAHDDLAAKVAAMDMLVQTLARDNEQMRAKIAQLEQRHTLPSTEWIALKAADHGSYTYECVRSWCQSGLIEAEKRGGRWFVNKISLATHLAQLRAA